MRVKPVWRGFRVHRRRRSAVGPSAVPESPRAARQRFIETALAARGRVVGLDQEVSILHNGERLSFGYPVVRFVTDAGQEVEFRSIQGFLPCRARIGDDVIVYYDPREPGKARLEQAHLL